MHVCLQLEQLDAEICDEVYETYTDLLVQREDEDDPLCYKTYTLVLVVVLVKASIDLS